MNRSKISKDFLSVLFLLFMTILQGPGLVQADVLDNLVTRNTLPQSSYLNAVTYGNGIFVAVGYNACIMTSTDGISWVQRLTDRSYQLENDWFAGVTFGNGTFVAIGHFGQIHTSTDGISWTNTSPSNSTANYNELNAVTYALVGSTPTFVAVGNNGLVLTSTDGGTWSSRTSGTSSYLRGVTCGNFVFVAVGDAVSNSGTLSLRRIPSGSTRTTPLLSTAARIPAGLTAAAIPPSRAR